MPALRAVEAAWPWASVVVGNPPFLGQRFQVRELGETYVKNLRRVYGDKVSGNVDLVCYWFVKAINAVKKNEKSIAGFVATNSIRGGDNRDVLESIFKSFKIFDAWSDEKWVNEGAAVRVSLICFGFVDLPVLLNGLKVCRINADLSPFNLGDTDVNLTLAVPLFESKGAAYSGFKMNGSFDIPEQVAREWLALPNPHGLSNSTVLHPYSNARDITGRSRNQWVIYFPNIAESDAVLFEKPFEWVLRNVKVERQSKREENLRNKWWLHERPRPELRFAISGTPRFIATPMVSKFRLFAWLPNFKVPENAAIVIARADDTMFGVLHSRFHEVWSLKMCTWMGKGNDPRYTPTTCFETFPFPHGLTPADTAHQTTETLPGGETIPDGLLETSVSANSTSKPGVVKAFTAGTAIKKVANSAATNSGQGVRTHAIAIAQAAYRLNALREAWLNPPEWTQRLPEVIPLGMASSPYPDRIVAKLGHDKDLAECTLTKLYNHRPAWLAAAHHTLDMAVAAAYGWADYSGDMGDDELLKRLLALNLARAAQ